MYGKVFSSMFDGSMMGSGPWVFTVWTYAITFADQKGYVELNPRLISAKIDGTLASVEKVKLAITTLCEPDAESRTKDEDGRRLIREGEFLYRIVNYVKYRAIRDQEERREYMRVHMKQKRDAERQLRLADVSNVSPRYPPLAHAEGEGEEEGYIPGGSGGARKKSSLERRNIIPPAKEGVVAYWSEAKLRGDPGDFFDHFTSNGWKVGGKTPMKDWEAAARRWSKNDEKFNGTGTKPAKTARDIWNETEAKRAAKKEQEKLIP